MKITKEMIQDLQKQWIPEYELTATGWGIKLGSNESAIVSGTLKVNVGINSYSVKVTIRTHADEESVGRAMQSINQNILLKLQDIQ